TPAATTAAFLAAMGAETDEPPWAPVVVVRAGDRPRLPVSGATEVTLEDGGTLWVEGEIPPDLPFGYHHFAVEGGDTGHLIVGPGRCHLPPDLREWGWTVQVPCVRSRRSWGIGDFDDLRRLAAWSAAALGAGITMVNPLGPARPGLPQEPSPYSPSTR